MLRLFCSAVLAERRLDDTEQELQATRGELMAVRDEFASTTAELRLLLQESRQRERQLQIVNDEANRLIVLAGLNVIPLTKGCN